jgi:GxxExxY protein
MQEEHEQEDHVVSEKGYHFGSETNRIMRAAIAVHKGLGPGFVEYTYQSALAVELQHCGIVYQREVELPIFYRNVQVDLRRADFLVGDIILELKAVEQLIPEHVAQLAMYLKAARKKLGLVLNFGASRLQARRVVN